mgnify:CR=1 FL=1
MRWILYVDLIGLNRLVVCELFPLGACADRQCAFGNNTVNDLLHGVIDFREGNFYQIINLANVKFVKLRFPLSVGDNWYVAWKFSLIPTTKWCACIAVNLSWMQNNWESWIIYAAVMLFIYVFTIIFTKKVSTVCSTSLCWLFKWLRKSHKPRIFKIFAQTESRWVWMKA